MERLAHEPMSRWRAEDALEDPRWFGYTAEAKRLDDVTDWLMNLWHATSQAAAGNKKIKHPGSVERPENKKKKKPASFDDVGAFFSSA